MGTDGIYLFDSTLTELGKQTKHGGMEWNGCFTSSIDMYVLVRARMETGAFL